MLEREVADPRIGFATVTKVETTPDLRHAKVWVSIIGREAELAAMPEPRRTEALARDRKTEGRLPPVRHLMRVELGLA